MTRDEILFELSELRDACRGSVCHGYARDSRLGELQAQIDAAVECVERGAWYQSLHHVHWLSHSLDVDALLVAIRQHEEASYAAAALELESQAAGGTLVTL